MLTITFPPRIVQYVRSTMTESEVNHEMMDWTLAACRDVDPELFFPVSSTGTEHGLYERSIAKSVCAGCPIRSTCLEWALVTGQDVGIWGGYDEDERRALRRLDRQRQSFKQAA